MENLIKLIREGYNRDSLVKKVMKPITDKEKLFPKTEASGDKEEYQKFFNAAMKKFGVKSPAELKGDKELEFYDYIDKNWKGDHEESVELALEFGTPNMSDADKANLRRRIKDMQKSKKKESVTEATNMFTDKRTGFKIDRFSMGDGKVGFQIKYGKADGYIQVPMKEIRYFISQIKYAADSKLESVKESVTEATLNPNDNVDQFLSKHWKNQMVLTAYLRKIFKIGSNDFNNSIYFDGPDLVSGSKTVMYDVLGNEKLKVSDLIKALEKHLKKKAIKESVTEATLNPNDNVDQFLSKDLMNQMTLTAYLRKIFKIGSNDFNNAIYFDGADLVSGSKTVLRDVIGNKKLKVSDLIKALEKHLKKKAIKESVGTNGQSLEADEMGRGLSPKAQFVKSMLNPEVAVDANKTALQTFASIMNSVSAKGAPRSGDNTEQDNQ